MKDPNNLHRSFGLVGAIHVSSCMYLSEKQTQVLTPENSGVAFKRERFRAENGSDTNCELSLLWIRQLFYELSRSSNGECF